MISLLANTSQVVRGNFLPPLLVFVGILLSIPASIILGYDALGITGLKRILKILIPAMVGSILGVVCLVAYWIFDPRFLLVGFLVCFSSGGIVGVLNGIFFEPVSQLSEESATLPVVCHTLSIRSFRVRLFQLPFFKNRHNQGNKHRPLNSVSEFAYVTLSLEVISKKVSINNANHCTDSNNDFETTQNKRRYHFLDFNALLGILIILLYTIIDVALIKYCIPTDIHLGQVTEVLCKAAGCGIVAVLCWPKAVQGKNKFGWSWWAALSGAILGFTFAFLYLSIIDNVMGVSDSYAHLIYSTVIATLGNFALGGYSGNIFWKIERMKEKKLFAWIGLSLFLLSILCGIPSAWCNVVPVCTK